MALSRSLFWGVRSLGAEGSPRRRSIDLYYNDGVVTRLCRDEGTFHLSFKHNQVLFCTATLVEGIVACWLNLGTEARGLRPTYSNQQARRLNFFIWLGSSWALESLCLSRGSRLAPDVFLLHLLSWLVE